MKITAGRIGGLFLVESSRFADDRGSFGRCFCRRELAPVLGEREIVQMNLSRTLRVGAVRGLHFQHAPHAEMKLVRCLKGKVFDVAVDLRRGSPTFLQWHAEELSPENGLMMVIPEGCAHGFQVLAPDSELLYLHTACYEPHAEGGLRCDDPRLALPWPLPIAELSERDRSHPALPADFTGIEI